MTISIGTNIRDVKSGQGFSAAVDRLPDECPVCHVAILPTQLANLACYVPPTMQVPFQCPRPTCGAIFIAYYAFGGEPVEVPWRSSPAYFSFQRTAPTVHREQVFPDQVKSLSKPFVEIYNQALAAEELGLDQIGGMGIRKSLEFLVKDYAISRRPADTEAIKKTALAACINNYIDDPRIKKMAERATWLGNDETHYVRRWESKDVSDLKILVKLTVNWMENVLLTEQYEAEMAKPQGS